MLRRSAPRNDGGVADSSGQCPFGMLRCFPANTFETAIIILLRNEPKSRTHVGPG